MTRLSALVLSVACLAPGVGAAQGPPPGTLVIEGRKNPELFPQWFVWEQTFLRLGGGSHRRLPLHEEIGLSAQEAKLLAAEIAAFEKLRAALARQIRDVHATLRAAGRREDDIHDATQELDIAYRHRILEGRQRLHENLSPEAFQNLQEWIEHLTRRLNVSVRGRRLEYFYLPG